MCRTPPRTSSRGWPSTANRAVLSSAGPTASTSSGDSSTNPWTGGAPRAHCSSNADASRPRPRSITPRVGDWPGRAASARTSRPSCWNCGRQHPAVPAGAPPVPAGLPLVPTPTPPAPPGTESVREGVDPGHRPAQGQLVHFVRAFVGEHGLEVDRVAQRRILARDARTAEEGAQVAADVHGRVDAHHLAEADLLGTHARLRVLELAQMSGQQCDLRILAQGLRELLLRDLERRQRAVELDAGIGRASG